MSEKWMVKNPWFRQAFYDTYEAACRWMDQDVAKAVAKYEGERIMVKRGADEIKIHFPDFYLHWKVIKRG